MEMVPTTSILQSGLTNDKCIQGERKVKNPQLTKQ
jgi:hypothetical protein